MKETEIKMGIGGTGGVYFLVSPGEFVVEVEKRDLHVHDLRTELRALLVGPDRRLIQEVTIPDDGLPVGSGMGPPQKVRLSAQVERKGIYVLNITVSQDRYGEEIVWGFRTNCPNYLVETSRGHKDERHQEPIVLLNPDKAGDVCFLPRQGSLALEVFGLPDGGDALGVFDAEGTLIQSMPAHTAGRASHVFGSDVGREAAPWRLHFPSQQAVIDIDGVTRWEEDDLYPEMSFWTPHLESFFPLHLYRWLLTPYCLKVYGRPGEEGETSFQVHNNSGGTKTIQLSIEFPDDEKWPVGLSCESIEVGAKETAEVTVRYTNPDSPELAGDGRVCHLRVTPLEDPEFSTYSTLILKNGEAPSARNLELPIVLKPYQHENGQFGYLPDYPVSNQVYFDLENQPFILTASGIDTHRDGHWMSSDIPGAPITKIAFGAENDLYLVATVDGHGHLLHSSDGAQAFAAHLLEAKEDRLESFDIEQFSGHNVPGDPPPVLRYSQTEDDDRLKWRSLNDLELFLPAKVDGRLSVGEPILISDRCIGLAAHSGTPSSVVSRGSKVHVAWAEATDPEIELPGVPTYVATFDRKAERLGEKILIGYGPPPNDAHNSPSITMDSQGYLHVLVGTHGAAFPYARSLKPNDATSGWTEAEDVREGLLQTYVGLVCDSDDTLHLVFRLWVEGSKYHPASYCAVLSHMKKPPGEPWSEPRRLVVPPFSEYSIYYHRLTIDRLGRLFLSYDYWSTYWFYRNDHRGNRRALMMSDDGGDTWKLVDLSDFFSDT